MSAELERAVLFVKDLARMKAFYVRALGCEPIEEEASEGWAPLRAGAVVLALHQIPAGIAERIEVSSPACAREESPTRLVFRVDDLDAARAHLAANGAVMLEKKPWGSCDGLDPEGNVFQVVARTERSSG